MRFRSSLAFRAVAVTALTVSCLAITAQVAAGRADLSGRVTDASGAAVPNATLHIIDQQRGTSRNAISDKAGYYSAPALEVGVYAVVAHAVTFADQRVDAVELTVGSSVAINITMRATAVSSVEVNANSDLARTTEVDNNALISNEQVEDLPTRGRDFTDFALLTPGISQEIDRFGLVINGQRSSNVYLSIDGVDFNDSLQGGQRGGNNASVYFFPQVAVREFQVVRTGVPADVGRTNGGFVNVVTKSGVNRFHGEAFFTNRNPAFTWPDPYNDPATDNIQEQFGVGIGGPILRDKLFFFAGVEKNLLQVPYAVRFTTPAGYCEATPLNATQVPCANNPALKPLPSNIDAMQVNTYGLNNPLASFGRLDYQLNDSNRLTMQYTSTFLSGLDFGQTATTAVAASGDTVLAQQSQGIVLGLTSVLRGTRTNDLRVQFVYAIASNPPQHPEPKSI